MDVWALGERGVYSIEIEDGKEFWENPVAYLENKMDGDMLTGFDDMERFDCE